MKQFILCSLLLINGAAYGACRFEGQTIQFKKVEAHPPHGAMEATLSADLTARVTLTQGHSGLYRLTVSYLDAEFFDEYVDFQPPRVLRVQGRTAGSPFSCEADPETVFF